MPGMPLSRLLPRADLEGLVSRIMTRLRDQPEERVLVGIAGAPATRLTSSARLMRVVHRAVNFIAVPS